MSDGSFRAVWEAELDRLELDVVRVERMLAGAGPASTETWTPPAVAGPMPADLAQRARGLLDRQDRATTALREALASAQRQLAYGARVSGATAAGKATPVYVDVEA